MNQPSKPSRERLLDLLADQATQGLSPAELAELDLLRACFPDVDTRVLERTAALLDRVSDPFPPEPLPQALQNQVEQQLLDLMQLSRARTPSRGGSLRLPSPWVWSGWAAAAACLALFFLWPTPRPTTLITPTNEANLALLQDPGVVKVAAATPVPTQVPGFGGEIVWSNSRQEGYLRVTGFPENDPREFQYQLWIFDGDRDEKHPIHAGLFDVICKNEVLVPIRPKLPVRRPVAFAVTREKPGGVVVSDKKHVVIYVSLERR